MLTVITDRGAFLVPPCPPWCTQRPDHDADDPFSIDVGGLLRHHGRDWALPGHKHALAIEVCWTEGIGYLPGTGPSEAPGLYLYADDCGSPVTSAQARELAQLLLQAADFYDWHVR